MPNTATLKNAYKGRKTDEDANLKVPQSFSFMRRAGGGVLEAWLCFSVPDMPGQGHALQKDENLPKRLRAEGADCDVFAMVKSYMSDTSLSQPPLLVYPASFYNSSACYFRGVCGTDEVVQQSLEDDRKADLLRVADCFEKNFPHLGRAAAYYRSLVAQDRPRKPYSKLAFLEMGPPERSHVSDVQLGEKQVAARSHFLQVVFHQRPEL